MKTRPKAFTLVELLTVVAIIAMLVGVLLPALNNARTQAKRTRVVTQFHAIDTGMELFRNDFNQYPTSDSVAMEMSLGSNAVLNGGTQSYEVGTPAHADDSASNTVFQGNSGKIAQGAHLLADAMVGRDLLGYDPTTDVGNSPLRWDPVNVRSGPYLDSSKTETQTVATDANGREYVVHYPTRGSGFVSGTTSNRSLRHIEDVFGSPVLYYRANPNITAASNAHQIYRYGDNLMFVNMTTKNSTVKDGTDFKHVLWVESGDADPSSWDAADEYPTLAIDEYSDGHEGEFYDFIMDKKASAATGWTAGNTNGVARPYNADKFLLMSPGPNKVFGDSDDVMNFARQE